MIAPSYDFGPVTLAFRVGADGLEQQGFVERVDRVERCAGGLGVWTEQPGRVRQLIGLSLDRPTQAPLEGD